MKHRLLIAAASLLVSLTSSCGGLTGWRQDTTARITPPPPPVHRWRKHFTDPKLQALTQKALANNLDLKIALQRIESAKAQVSAAKGALAPVVKGTAGVGLTKFGYYTMDGAGNKTTQIIGDEFIPQDLADFMIGLQTSWEIDLWGRLRSKRNAAISRFLASVEGRNLVQTSLIASLASAYYDLLALDAELEIINETVALQENALATIQAQKMVGAANELGVQQFEAQLFNLRGMRVEARQKIVETEGVICSLLGDHRRPVERSHAALLHAGLPQLSTNLPANVLQDRPDIRRAELELVAAKADVKAAKAAFMPTLNINGLIGLQAFRADLLFNPHSLTYSAAGGLVAPLINRRAIQAEFDQASASQLEALYAYQQAIVNGYVEVHNQLSSIHNLREIHELKTKEIGLLHASINTSSELFKSRRATYLDLLNAQQTALKAKLQLVEVRKRQFQVQANLYKSLGGG